jgi:hypothetical protein
MEGGLIKILETMHQYQKDNSIKNECITNAQFFYDCMNSSGIPAKAKAVITVHSNGDDNVVTSHICIQLEDGTLIDPSYDIHSSDANYYESLASIRKTIMGISNGLNAREFITNWLKFLEYEKIINSGVCLVSNRDYYNKQADYVSQTIK